MSKMFIKTGLVLEVDGNKTFFVETGNCNDQSRYENIFSQYRHWFRIMDGIFFPIYFDHRKSSLISRMVNVTEMKVLWSFSMIHNNRKNYIYLTGLIEFWWLSCPPTNSFLATIINCIVVVNIIYLGGTIWWLVI